MIKMLNSTCILSSGDKDSFADFPYFFIVILRDLMVFHIKGQSGL